uniref:Transcriptional enhancer factor TEF-1 n=1 Tax=Daphnia magna TaxID=35525 RepID=A0A0P6HAC7_9CRUS
MKDSFRMFAPLAAAAWPLVSPGEAWALSGAKLSSSWQQQQQQQQQNQAYGGSSTSSAAIPGSQREPTTLSSRTDAAVDHNNMAGELPLSPEDLSSDDEKDLASADAEGVWSPDIEQSFQEALAIYPPCGRRKIILSDEGKMYGRNELIARYIKLRTGKTRTRKQVSSHIQVLARRKLREIQSKIKNASKDEVLRLYGSVAQDQATKEKALQNMSSMSSAQIVSASSLHNNKTSLSGLGLPAPVSYPPPFWQPGLQPGPSQDVKPFAQSHYAVGASPSSNNKSGTSNGGTGSSAGSGEMAGLLAPSATPNAPSSSTASSVTTVATTAGLTPPAPPPPWEGRAIATHKLRLVEFSAFLEQQRDPDTYHKHLFVQIGGATSYSDPMLEAVDIRQIYDKFPEKKGGLKELFDKGPQNAFFLVKFWADLSTNITEDVGAFYAVTSQYESNENMTITCSTKVCSFGKQVVEKVETEYARFENGRFVYRIHRSPMCEYMINFIHKLKHLPEKYMMNSVLENFTILQVVTNRDTQETLQCVAYVFEVSTSEHGAQHHIYRLVKD